MGRTARGRSFTGALLAALLACLALGSTAARAAFPCGTALVRCQVQLDNSGRAWFESYEKLTEDALGDGSLKHGVFQVYERDGDRTLLVSRRPDGSPIPPDPRYNVSAWLLGVSPDGERVYIQTEDSLAPDDLDGGHGDGSTDAYVLSQGQYTLFTTGPLDNGPNTNPYIGSHGIWASDDGSYEYFETGQQLVPEDWDGASDVYQRHDGQTRLVSTGPDQTLPTPEFPNPAIPETRLLGASPDGATAYFATAEHLTADDTAKPTIDIFAWRDGVTTRLTRTVSPEEVPGTPWESFDPYSFAGGADEGSIYFTANSPQTPDDTDANPDIYRARPDGTLERLTLLPPGNGPADNYLRLQAVSRDGTRLFVFASRRLAAADHDDAADVYMWSGGRFQLITPESEVPVKDEETMLCSISGDGRRAYFQTWGRITPEDTDDEPDVYEWSEGKVRLVSPAGEGHQSASFCAGISPNGRYVAFSTWEELVPGDNDTKQDIYVIDMGAAGAGATASASSSAAARPRNSKRHRHLRLVTAESIAPRMKIGPSATRTATGASLRLRCPKAETSGPCHGRVKLLTAKSHRVLSSAGFRIASDHAATVKLAARRLPGHVLVRVRGADELGNRRTVSATLGLRR